MKMQLFINQSDDNTINKKLLLVDVIDVMLKRDVDIIRPDIVLQVDKIPRINEVNYCYFDDLERYYFVKNVSSLNSKIVKVSCEVDVLESFKNDILNSGCTFKKRVEVGDFGDISIDSTGRNSVVHYVSDSGLKANNTIILSVLNYNSQI